MSGNFGQTNDGKETERNLQPAAAARRFKTKATEKNKQRRPTKTTTIGCFVNLCHFWPLTLSEREPNIVALSAKQMICSLDSTWFHIEWDAAATKETFECNSATNSWRAHLENVLKTKFLPQTNAFLADTTLNVRNKKVESNKELRNDKSNTLKNKPPHRGSLWMQKRLIRDGCWKEMNG